MPAQSTDLNKLVIDRNTIKGSPAYLAGLDINDEVLQLDETEVKSISDVNNFLKMKKPGDAVLITYKHRGVERKTTAILQEQTGVILIPFEQSGKTVTPDMQKIRDSWFTSHIK